MSEAVSIFIQPEDVVRVEVHTDNRKKSLSILNNGCLLEQGRAPCSGKVAEGACYGKYSKCNDPGKSVCLDILGRTVEENGGEVPDWVRVDWAEFFPETWEIRELIDKETLKPKEDGSAFMRRDLYKSRLLRLRYGLKDWSLSKVSDKYELRHEQAKGLSPGTEQLTKESLEIILKTIHPDFIDQMLRAYDRVSLEAYADIEEDAVEQITEATGLKAKN